MHTVVRYLRILAKNGILSLFMTIYPKNACSVRKEIAKMTKIYEILGFYGVLWLAYGNNCCY